VTSEGWMGPDARLSSASHSVGRLAKGDQMGVAIGVDSHKSSLAAAGVDELGRSLGAREFANTPAGHKRLLGWARAVGEARVIGVEGSGIYGAGLAGFLLLAGEDVREVPASLTHRERRRKASQGKSDVVDALAIARVVAREKELPTPERSVVLADLKALCDYRDQLVRARTQVANRAHRDLVVLRPGYEQAIPNLTGKRYLGRASSLLRGDHSVRAELLRRRIEELRRLSAEMAAIEAQIGAKVRDSKTTLTEIAGIGPLLAATILGEVGNVGRIRSRAAFAKMAGTAPLQASSGMTHRHRLNRGGNRRLNWALHDTALCCYRTPVRGPTSSVGGPRASRSRRRCGASSGICPTSSTGACSRI
jgi:transposase